MLTIFKYPLEITDEQIIELPIEAKVLSVGEQNGGLFLWAIIDTEKTQTRKYKFLIVGTGNEMPEAADNELHRFIGTVQIKPYVWHVFEVENLNEVPQMQI